MENTELSTSSKLLALCTLLNRTSHAVLLNYPFNQKILVDFPWIFLKENNKTCKVPRVFVPLPGILINPPHKKTASTHHPVTSLQSCPQGGTGLACVNIKGVKVKRHVYRWEEIGSFLTLACFE